MPGTVLVEIPLDQEAGFVVNTVTSTGEPGEDSNVNSFELDNPAYYQSAPDGTEEPPVEVWIGCTVPDAQAILTATVTQPDGTLLVDSVQLHSKAAQTVGAVLSQVIFRKKPTP